VATITSDSRTVTVSATKAELIDLLATRAKAAGLIDFDPDGVQVREEIDANGNSEFEIIFEKRAI